MAELRQRNITGAVRDYGRRLFRFIRGRVPSDADAEDVLQDVWRQLSGVVDVEAIEQLGAWLFRVARNQLTDRHRRKAARPETPLEDLAYEDEDGLSDFRDMLLPSADGTPETEFWREAFWEELFTALDDLPESQRNVFIWNELEGETLQQIADKTGENLKTIISRKRYAVQHLRVRLEVLYQELGEI